MGRPIRTFTVLPHLPERLQALHKLAYNLWWCWNPEAIALFRRIDADLFENVEHSPVKLLGGTDQARLEQLQSDDGFLAHMDRVEQAFETYMTGATWFDESFLPKFKASHRICRFSATTCASPTSVPSSACTRVCRFTPAASACFPATT